MQLGPLCNPIYSMHGRPVFTRNTIQYSTYVRRFQQSSASRDLQRYTGETGLKYNQTDFSVQVCTCVCTCLVTKCLNYTGMLGGKGGEGGGGGGGGGGGRRLGNT